MDENDENLKKQMANAEAFKKAVESNRITEFLSKIEEQLSQINERTSKILLATLDENKQLKDYDYYEPIKKEFEDIYEHLNENNILNPFSKGPRLDVVELKNKIGEANPEECGEIANELFKTLGLNVNVDFSGNIDGKKLRDDLISGMTERLMNEPNLNKKLEKLYFSGITHIVKAIDEYSHTSQKLKEINDPRLRGFIIQLLYLKAYEENLAVLSNAYSNITGKDKKSFEKSDEYYKSFNQFTSEHNILNETMDRELRNGIAHSTYEKLETYTQEKILGLARRNFITSIIGIVIKTNKIVERFRDNSSKIAIY